MSRIVWILLLTLMLSARSCEAIDIWYWTGQSWNLIKCACCICFKRHHEDDDDDKKLLEEQHPHYHTRQGKPLTEEMIACLDIQNLTTEQQISQLLLEALQYHSPEELKHHRPRRAILKTIAAGLAAPTNLPLVRLHLLCCHCGMFLTV